MRNAKRWEIRLGPVQAVIVVGVAMGAAVAGFYLGFFAGHSVGFESAMSKSLANLPKLPIGGEAVPEGSGEQIISEVYASLNEQNARHSQPGAAPAKTAEPIPDLSSIQASAISAVLPTVPAVASAAGGEKGGAVSGNKSKATALQPPPTATPGKPAATPGGTGGAPGSKASSSGDSLSERTLGALFEETEREVGAKGAAKTDAAPHTASAAASKIPTVDPTVDPTAVPATPSATATARATATVRVTATVARATPSPATATATSRPTAPPPTITPTSTVTRAAPTETPRKTPTRTPAPTATVVRRPTLVPTAIPLPKLAVPPPQTLGGVYRGSVPRGWFAQVAAPKEREDADELAAKLRSSGFVVVIENAQVRGEAYYRVLVGPEESRNQAEILIKQLKRERYLDGEPFLRMVK